MPPGLLESTHESLDEPESLELEVDDDEEPPDTGEALPDVAPDEGALL